MEIPLGYDRRVGWRRRVLYEVLMKLEKDLLTILTPKCLLCDVSSNSRSNRVIFVPKTIFKTRNFVGDFIYRIKREIFSSTINLETSLFFFVPLKTYGTCVYMCTHLHTRLCAHMCVHVCVCAWVPKTSSRGSLRDFYYYGWLWRVTHGFVRRNVHSRIN